MALAETLRVLREEAGLRQKELADRLGCGLATVSAWETGHRHPNSEQRQRLTQVLRIQEWQLFAPPDLVLPAKHQDLAPILERMGLKAEELLRLTDADWETIRALVKALIDHKRRLEA